MPATTLPLPLTTGEIGHHVESPAALPIFPEPGGLLPGDRVEVQNRFDGRWSRGFEVVDVLVGMGTRRYRIRRLSDGAVLPRLFVEGEVDQAR